MQTEFINIPKIKNGSKIILGRRDQQFIFMVDQHFNWFQKKMIRLCFGFLVEDFTEV